MPRKPHYPLALPAAERFKLRFGKYSTPPFRYGQRVNDGVRGEVVVVGMTDAKISWPIGKRGRCKSPVIYRGLLRALKSESAGAICHWWGVAPCTVAKWRKLLGIKGPTKGSSQLRSIYFKGEAGRRARIVGHTRLRTPERRAKIAAAKRGKPRPAHVQSMLRTIGVGKIPSDETRRKLSEAARRRKAWPPFIKNLWTAKEKKLAMNLELPAREVAAKINRTAKAVGEQRRVMAGRVTRQRQQ